MNFKQNVVFGTVLAALAVSAATPQIAQDKVTIEQDQSRLVTITYDLEDAPGIVTADIQTNRGDGVYCSIGGQYLATMYGDVNTYQTVDKGKKIYWQPDQAWPNHKISIVDGGVRAVVTAWATNCPPNYMTVDLQVANDVRFYANAESVPYGVTNEIYKKDILLMRKIPAGGVRWRMGAPSSETGYDYRYETAHYVTLTKDYYMGVYMLTQRQYKDVMGSLPSGCQGTGSADSPMHPVNCISVDNMRGNASAGGAYDWPNTTPMHKVDPDSVVGKLRAKCGNVIEFDIPTSAQWEYACRAGTFTAYNNGKDSDVAEVAWYGDDDGEMHAVGLKKPNAFGLYDMHGLHYEYCLDWYDHHESSADEIDPVGPATSWARTCRGGTYRKSSDYVDNVNYLRSAAYYSAQLNYAHARFGGRVCAPAIYFAPVVGE